MYLNLNKIQDWVTPTMDLPTSRSALAKLIQDAGYS